MTSYFRFVVILLRYHRYTLFWYTLLAILSWTRLITAHLRKVICRAINELGNFALRKFSVVVRLSDALHSSVAAQATNPVAANNPLLIWVLLNMYG